MPGQDPSYILGDMTTAKMFIPSLDDIDVLKIERISTSSDTGKARANTVMIASHTLHQLSLK
jgi:hypothetical protein